MSNFTRTVKSLQSLTGFTVLKTMKTMQKLTAQIQGDMKNWKLNVADSAVLELLNYEAKSL